MREFCATHLEIWSILDVVRVEDGYPAVDDHGFLVEGTDEGSMKVDDLQAQILHLFRVWQAERNPRRRRHGDMIAVWRVEQHGEPSGMARARHGARLTSKVAESRHDPT